MDDDDFANVTIGTDVDFQSHSAFPASFLGDRGIPSSKTAHRTGTIAIVLTLIGVSFMRMMAFASLIL